MLAFSLGSLTSPLSDEPNFFFLLDFMFYFLFLGFHYFTHGSCFLRSCTVLLLRCKLLFLVSVNFVFS